MALPTPSSTSTQSAATVQALVGEFFEHKQREKQEVSLAAQPDRLRKILAITALITCAIVWILPSLYQPAGEAPSAEREEASVRMTLFLASERVRAYQQVHGALPRNLAQANVDSAEMSYVASSGDSFRLSMRADGHEVLYRSDMKGVDFLGSAVQTLTTSR